MEQMRRFAIENGPTAVVSVWEVLEAACIAALVMGAVLVVMRGWQNRKA